MHGIAPHGDCVQFLFQMSKNFNDWFLYDKITCPKCSLLHTVYRQYNKLDMRQFQLDYTK